jgi:hypothetical protein
MTNNLNKSITADILAGAGRCLFVAQMVEFSLANLCSMFPDIPISTEINPILFGLSKERTPSVGFLLKALPKIGIDSSYYLSSEIDDFVKRRDWLAHRMFLDLRWTPKIGPVVKR